MKIAMSSGHGKYIRGAAGSPIPPCVDEVDEARKIVDQVAIDLKAMGVEVVTFHDNTSKDQSTNLNTITTWHNKQTRDLDVSVHLNCYDKSAHGVEVLYITQEALARKVSAAIAEAGPFTDRGPKKRTDLAFLNNTNKPAVLIETFFCDNKSDCDKYHAKFAAICTSIAESLSGQQAQPAPTPPVDERPPVGGIDRPPSEPPPTGGHQTIAAGDKGPEVVDLQQKLGVLKADGDFGGITDTWVQAFQGACGLAKDGVVGPMTWDEVDALDARLQKGEPPLPLRLAEQIYNEAQQSEIADYSWKDRGVAPPGYIAGMALSFAYAMRLSSEQVRLMSRAQGSQDTDALAWYSDQFAALGMDNHTPGINTLRHLFVLMIGLGPRESSGRYFEGRDLSASNVESDTCEAGLFQTSWNIRNGSPHIGPLLTEFWDNPNGFLDVFKEGLNPSKDNLNSYGSGDGIKYQFLSRYCPLFHVMVTGCGLRVLRKHWGPINERKAELQRGADNLLKTVEEMVDDAETA